MTFFVILRKISRKLYEFFSSLFEIPKHIAGGYQSTLKGLRILPPFMTAQFFCSFRDLTFFVVFQKVSENLTNFDLHNLKFPTMYLGLSECSSGLRTVPPFMTAQLFVVFDI